MRKITLIYLNAFALLWSGLCHDSVAQDQDSVHIYKLASLQNFFRVPWRDSVYLLPQFQKGTLTYMHGFNVEGSWQMNYNRFFESMNMISDAGDTLSVKRIPELKFVNLPGRTFFHDYNLGFIEILMKTPVALGAKHIMATLNYINTLDLRGYISKYDRYYADYTLFFFFDPNNVLHRANQLSILKLYPENRQEIKDYLFEKPVNFKKEEDLVRLLNFCKQFDFFFEKTESPEFLRLAAGKILSNAPWRKKIYKYPEFQPAWATLKDRTSSEYPYRVNYNYFSGLMDCIYKDGDTLTVKRSENIRVANLDGDIFYFDPDEGYLELLFQGTVNLGVKDYYKLVRKEILEDDYSARSPSQAIMRSYGNAEYNSAANFDRLYWKTRSYFFINGQYKTLPANKKTIFSMFPGYKKEITEYLNKNDPDFKNETDLTNLLSFCNALRH